MKLLAIDIEMSPNIAHVWGLWNVNVSLAQLRESATMMCFAAKWVGEDEMFFFSQHDENMVEEAHDLLDQADVVLHYNGKRFDIPHLNREFLAAGMNPPAPFQQIDLYSAVKRRFRFPSNKLDYVARALGLDGKVHHEGHELWVKCMAGDEDAWDLMQEYNMQDVLLLEQLYAKLLPWIPNHPNRALIDGVLDACSSCGKTGTTVLQGYTHTMVSAYQRYLCTSCGKWTRGSKRLYGADIREAAL